MKPTLFLRIASVLTLVHSLMHTVGGVFGKPVPGIAATTDALMRANHFQVFGETRSYWEFYHGLGLGITISLTAEGLLFWFLGSLAKKHAAELRPVLWVFTLAYLAFAVNSYTYFFDGPVVAELVIAVCLLGAIATAKQVSAKQPLHLRTAADTGN
jgi:hypothetical protein